MLANYGYSDGSGNYFITIDTDKCNACGACVKACPAKIFLVVDEDPNDPMNEQPLVIVVPEHNKKLRYECETCKPSVNVRPHIPCVQACETGALSHFWQNSAVRK
ncbi:MAG: 4Fe-4S binding protein [Pseudomonadota bacterium]